MNLREGQATDGVAAALQNDDDEAVDPHLERIRNQAGAEESDEEVTRCSIFRPSSLFF